MSYRLSGINPLAYIGVEPLTPPAMIVQPRSPTSGDSKGYNLGSLWLVAAPPPTQNWELWLLVDLTAGIATWVQLYPDSAAGIIRLDADVGFAIPTLGIVNVLGGPNINTFGDTSNNFFVNLNDSIRLPNTSSDGSQGVLFLGAAGGIGGDTFLHNYGSDNTFVGQLAGNLTLNVGLASANTGIGNNSLRSLTTGALNSALGEASLLSLTTGDSNVTLGSSSLQNVVTGSNNISLGVNSSQNYTGAESSNIIIGNDGVLGESNTIRIGTDGVGDGQQDAAYMAGVYGRSVGGTNEAVIIDNSGKLGSMTIVPVNPSQGFLGYLPTDTGIVSGNGAQYLLGSTVAFTTLFDISSSFFPGDGLGIPASFTAPTTGIYFFQVQILPFDNSVLKTAMIWPLIQIITPSTTYQNNLTTGPGGAVGGIIRNSTTPPIQTSTSFNTLANLTVGDIVTFQITSNYGSNQMSLNGAAYPLTFICGYLL